MTLLLIAVPTLTAVGGIALSKITKNALVGIIGLIMLIVAFVLGIQLAQQISQISVSVLP